MKLKLLGHYFLIVGFLINLEIYSAANIDHESHINQDYSLQDYVHLGDIEGIKKYCKSIDKIYYSPFDTEYNALSKAIDYQKYDIVEFLLNHGANPNLEVNSLLPLQRAINNSANHIAKLLLDHPQINLDSAEAFFEAVVRGNIVIVKLFLSKKIDINITDYEGETALIKAVAKNKLDVVEFLLQNGANVNMHTLIGSTALQEALNQFDYMFAPEKAIKQIIELLLQHGANICAENLYGQSFLDFALNSSSYKTVVQTYKNHLENLEKLNFEQATGKLNNTLDGHFQALDYQTLIEEQFALVNDVIKQKGKKGYKDSVNKLIAFLNLHPQFINCRFNGETILHCLILAECLDAIKELYKNPLVKRKPNLLNPVDNPVKMAERLGEPEQDPSKNTWREIAHYLKDKFDAQKKAVEENLNLLMDEKRLSTRERSKFFENLRYLEMCRGYPHLF